MTNAYAEEINDVIWKLQQAQSRKKQKTGQPLDQAREKIP
jgi:hypothetical protein